jgi:hypothetical protein
MLLGLCILYIVLILIERIFGLYWKEYTVGLITLSLVIAISYYIKSFYFPAFLWALTTLLEYNHYLRHYKD